MSYIVDYHVHTNFSDGTLKPVDVVKRYKDLEYDIIAITDHDGVGGISDAMVAGEALDLKVVPGIEIACNHPEAGELHILGYNIDYKNKDLLDLCNRLMEYRDRRNDQVIKKLEELGYQVDRATLIKRDDCNFIGKVDFVRYIRDNNIDVGDPWKFLEQFNKEKISDVEAINAIKGAGGIPVLAHPMKIRKLRPDEEGFFDRLDVLLRDLKKKGLKGLECYHPSASEEDSLKLVDLAEKYHLHVTEGSDFHGDNEKH